MPDVFKQAFEIAYAILDSLIKWSTAWTKKKNQLKDWFFSFRKRTTETVKAVQHKVELIDSAIVNRRPCLKNGTPIVTARIPGESFEEYRQIRKQSVLLLKAKSKCLRK